MEKIMTETLILGAAIVFAGYLVAKAVDDLKEKIEDLFAKILWNPDGTPRK